MSPSTSRFHGGRLARAVAWTASAAMLLLAGLALAAKTDLRVTVQNNNTVREWIGHAAHGGVVTWINHSKVDRTIVFVSGRWPFTDPQADIVLPAGGSVSKTIDASVAADKYEYAFIPIALPAKPGPPDGPAVVIDP